MQELREEVGVKESLRRKLVRSWLKWVDHMEGERLRLTKRADMLILHYVGRLRRRWEENSEGWGSGNRWWRRQ